MGVDESARKRRPFYAHVLGQCSGISPTSIRFFSGFASNVPPTDPSTRSSGLSFASREQNVLLPHSTASLSTRL